MCAEAGILAVLNSFLMKSSCDVVIQDSSHFPANVVMTIIRDFAPCLWDKKRGERLFLNGAFLSYLHR